MYEFSKFSDKEKNLFDGVTNDIDDEFSKIETENYHRVKENLDNLNAKLDEMKSENLLYQKQLTTLKKEKMDLINQILGLNNKLNDIEKDLGINLSSKRIKRKNNI
jgi:septation ring formation regulator EzrA